MPQRSRWIGLEWELKRRGGEGLGCGAALRRAFPSEVGVPQEGAEGGKGYRTPEVSSETRGIGGGRCQRVDQALGLWREPALLMIGGFLGGDFEALKDVDLADGYLGLEASNPNAQPEVSSLAVHSTAQHTILQHESGRVGGW